MGHLAALLALQLVTTGPAPQEAGRIPVDILIVEDLHEPGAVAVIVRRPRRDLILLPTTATPQHLRQAILAYRGSLANNAKLLANKTRVPVLEMMGPTRVFQGSGPEASILQGLRARNRSNVPGVGTGRLRTIWVTRPD